MLNREFEKKIVTRNVYVFIISFFKNVHLLSIKAERQKKLITTQINNITIRYLLCNGGVSGKPSKNLYKLKKIEDMFHLAH